MYKKYKKSLSDSSSKIRGVLAFTQRSNSKQTRPTGNEHDNTQDDEEEDEEVTVEFLKTELQVLGLDEEDSEECVKLMEQQPELNTFFRSAIYTCKGKTSATFSELSTHFRKLCRVKNISDSQKEQIAKFLVLVSFCSKSLKAYKNTLKVLGMEHLVERVSTEENDNVAAQDEEYEYYDEDLDEWLADDGGANTEGQGQEEENTEGQGEEEENAEGENEVPEVSAEEEGQNYGYEENDDLEEPTEEGGEIDEYYEQVYGDGTEETNDGEEGSYDEGQDENEEYYEAEEEDQVDAVVYDDDDDQSEETCLDIVRSIRNVWRIYSVFAPFAGKLATDGILRELVQDLKSRTETGSDPKSSVLIETIIIMFNIAKEPTTKKLFSKYKVVDLLEKAMGLVGDGYKFMVALTLALTIDDNQAALVSLGDQIIDDILDITRRAWDKKKKTYLGWSLEEMLPALCGLSKNDKRKKLLAEKGILPLLLEILRGGTDPQKEEAIKILWELSFHPENKTKIKEMKQMTPILDNLSKHKNKEIEIAAKGVLWEIKETSIRASSAVPGARSQPEGHIMISYCWAQKETVFKIRDELQKAGHKLWIDVENMEGSTLQAMAEAIEDAKLVLMCYSENYFNSRNCRAEAEYMYKENKPIIPLLMQQGYSAKKWLGIILGSRLYIDFSGKHPFDAKMKELKSQIANQLKH
ncbi:uncharacterized protein LOC131933303 [Physella acuta]|uniref:uncharacterized protein LOC131933303 n=1 Tax=Physella acuta TaxID=109671 RepID=UPI0027DBDA28|nr:uncharacterized protein LOC131933303 [Physella acuta]